MVYLQRVTVCGPADAGNGPASPEAVRSAVNSLLDSVALRGGPAAPGLHSITAGSRILVKPNWVFHENQDGSGFGPLLTDPWLLDAVVDALIRRAPASIVVGDAPIQGCDFGLMRSRLGIDDLAAAWAQRGPVTVRDLRAVELPGSQGWRNRVGTSRNPTDHVVFDLGSRSYLEEITRDDGAFRVTMYDPRRLGESHRPGTHRYLIAREALEADVIVSLPKLKTHRKAGLTGALKNLVGINAHKEFLPHHRRGAPARGGDCYERDSVLARSAELALDVSNANGPRPLRAGALAAAALLRRADRLTGGTGDLEGSWPGNDTVWRMCLDLHLIARYGTVDGELQSGVQRHLLSVTDAITVGEGEGPLAPRPRRMGLVSFSDDAAAADWVHARLMGLDPARIPLIHHALGRGAQVLPLFGSPPPAIVLDGEVSSWELVSRHVVPCLPPRGWRGRCEAEPRR